MTQYKPMPGFPGYTIGDDGTVWTHWVRRYGGKIGAKYEIGDSRAQIKTTVLKCGYVDFHLRRGGKSVHMLLHRAVLLAFVGDPPEGCESMHLNNDRADCRLLNLKWGTKTENQLQRRQFDTSPQGERHGLSKLKVKDVIEIRRSYASGDRITHIARRHKISRRVVGRIVRGEAWAHV